MCFHGSQTKPCPQTSILRPNYLLPHVRSFLEAHELGVENLQTWGWTSLFLFFQCNPDESTIMLPCFSKRHCLNYGLWQARNFTQNFSSIRVWCFLSKGYIQSYPSDLLILQTNILRPGPSLGHCCHSGIVVPGNLSPTCLIRWTPPGQWLLCYQSQVENKCPVEDFSLPPKNLSVAFRMKAILFDKTQSPCNLTADLFCSFILCHCTP